MTYDNINQCFEINNFLKNKTTEKEIIPFLIKIIYFHITIRTRFLSTYTIKYDNTCSVTSHSITRSRLDPYFKICTNKRKKW